ncbi:hypothetical protein ZHAS_00015337 [Anopheles sinensis]|uniref:Uncharacterized protein n=1 Tax=Anopheles sinensis TaxID=74873 RepID=A0A084WAR2_ANOSI|nr:hypothetical protein ZHAS_00015337 [Anopheles sinensis]
MQVWTAASRSEKEMKTRNPTPGISRSAGQAGLWTKTSVQRIEWHRTQLDGVG